MDGLYIRSKEEYIEKVIQDSAELSLTARGNGTEVMIQKINNGKKFYIYPADNNEVMEYFYIIEGSLIYEHNNEKLLKNGDYFYVHELKETVFFEAITDVTLIYISTEPVFHYLSNTINDLTDIAKKVEVKDNYTINHSDRVQEYSYKIAKKLGLSKNKLENITFSSFFHDLGKINVPDEILNKPGKLTDEEFEYIKKHPTDGKKLATNVYYKNLGEIIEQHHERLDGSGYPDGLKCDEIVIEAKIIAVADTYDAMTSDRPYRKGLSSQVAVDELRRLKGIHYDEIIVEIFIEILKEEGVIK